MYAPHALQIFKPNFELMVALQAHRDPVRSVTFAPTDLKFATASDDSKIHVRKTRKSAGMAAVTMAVGSRGPLVGGLGL